MTPIQDLPAAGLYSVVVSAVLASVWLPILFRNHIKNYPPTFGAWIVWTIAALGLWGAPILYTALIFLER